MVGKHPTSIDRTGLDPNTKEGELVLAWTVSGPHAVPACLGVVIASPVALDPADRDWAFWQCAVDQAELSEQQRLAAIEQGWSSRWLVALRQHLHLRLGELESLPAMSEATLARRVRQEGPLEPAVSERLDRLLEAIGLALSVFEDPATTETWLKAPHPLLQLSTATASPTSIRERRVGPEPRCARPGTPSWRL